MRTVTHNGRTCYFDDAYHKYTLDTGENLVSVTTFLKRFQKPFDPTGIITKRYAEKNGKTVAQVKADWKAKAERASQRGKLVHGYLECKFKGEPLPVMSLQHKDFINAVDSLYAKLTNCYEFISAEQILFSPSLGLAGTCDLIMKHKNSVILMDYKTNEEFTTSNTYDNLLPPYQFFEASKLNIYSLQLAVYKDIAEREGYYMNIRTGIIWVKPDGVEFIKPVEFDGSMNVLYQRAA